MSCSFDFADEQCPVNVDDRWQIQSGSLADRSRPISDHTRGGKRPSHAVRTAIVSTLCFLDGKYVLLRQESIDDVSRPARLTLGRFSRVNTSAADSHCLQLWYTVGGTGVVTLTVVREQPSSTESMEVIRMNSNGQGENPTNVCSREPYRRHLS
jgi:hypothetical protein